MKKHIKSISILSILMFGFIFSFYGKVLLSPNSYLIGTDGDGMKNYYTYQYLIKNNTSYTEFEGMNYPYQENFMYTDCHPFQASVLKFINHYIPSVSNYTIGLLNLFMIISIWITALILFFIFIELKINRWFAIFSAIGVTILSPQIFRLTGHWALSYSFFIPLIIYQLLLLNKRKAFKYYIFISITILLLFFTHGYIGMIAALIILTFVGVDMIFSLLTKQFKDNIKDNILLFSAGSLPILFFYIFMKMSDSHIGRTTNPWGILKHHSELANTFFPFINLGDYLSDWSSFNLKQPWEGMSYIGIVAMIGLVLFTYKLLINLKKNKSNSNRDESSFLLKLLIGGIIILCVSALLPFRDWWTILIEKVSLIKQFRAIGRFAWAFYFIANIVAIFGINSLIVKLELKKHKLIPNLLIVILPLIICLEGLRYYNYLDSKNMTSKNIFDIKQTSDFFKSNIQNIDLETYQAMIVLPYFYIGSDNYGKPSNDRLAKISFMYSYHLNLPMFNSYLTRTSILESKNIIQLLSSNFYSKAIQNDIKSKKPFLVLCQNINLTQQEQSILNKSKLISKNDNYSLFEISYKNVFKNTSSKEVKVYSDIKNSLFSKNNFLVSDTVKYLKYINFEDNTDSPFITTKGKKVNQKDFTRLTTILGQNLKQQDTLIARFWMYNGGSKNGQDAFNGLVFFEKEKLGEKEWIFPVISLQHTQQINGDWNMVEVILENIEIDTDYHLVLKGNDDSKLNFYIDDLLIYSKGLTVYKETPSYLFKNGHKIKMN